LVLGGHGGACWRFDPSYDLIDHARDYPENADLPAAIQLFAAVAMMFWYVLRLFMGSRSE
jgi:FtsH-binding integral membrane protein